MPTQEERLAALEQRTATHIEEVNENLAITIGLVHILTGDIKKIHRRIDDVQTSLQETLTIHIDATNAHFDLLQKHAEKTDKDMAEVKQDVASLKQDMAGVKQDVASLKQDMAGAKQDVASLKQDNSEIKATLALILARLPEKS